MTSESDHKLPAEPQTSTDQQKTQTAQPASQRTGSDNAALRELWSKYEETAMHFNDLIIRLRTHALGGLAAIGALSAVAVNFSGEKANATQWAIIFGTLMFLVFAWLAIAVIDLFYYRRLLLGAVAALLDIEHRSEGQIALSITIEEQFGEQTWRNCIRFRGRGPQFTFYAIVFGALGIATYCSYQQIAPAKESARLASDAVRDNQPATRGDVLQLEQRVLNDRFLTKDDLAAAIRPIYDRLDVIDKRTQNQSSNPKATPPQNDPTSQSPLDLE